MTNLTTVTGQPQHDSNDKKARPVTGQIRQDKLAGTGCPRQDSKNRTAMQDIHARKATLQKPSFGRPTITSENRTAMTVEMH
jgi:hypothetical protein